MNKTNRIVSVILLAFFSLGLLAGCAAKLPEGYDEDVVKSEAEKVIMLLDQRDVDGLTAMLTNQMKTGLTEDVKAQIFAALDDSGPVQEIEELKTTGSTENEITYGVVVAKVRHANREITYTISFDPEMRLAGLFLQ
ncbi:MAG: DUF3887 domain-containing protein [Anaerolineaceae bacterium]|nr:DUF3887 domain-containing protein [Anaerolineaceae bacterium]MDD4041879.1 DUF3887 domain-containing protein [Anaerolineaceae bacterium]MDD4577717.1 DUF3887 domain-containing protein [Anaerolineaceae bacterium]